MVLKVLAYSNNTNINNQKKDISGSFAVKPSTTLSQPEKDTVCITKANDGKFSGSEALKNYAKGLLSPITGMFSSVSGFLTGAGMILGSTALIVATGGAAAPVLVAAGVGFGAIQAGAAITKIAKAQNGDDYEKAFFDLGSASGAIGLSVAGAKPALKNAGIQTEGLNPITATLKTFKEIPALAKESYNTFKTGFYKVNILNFKNSFSEVKSAKKISNEICKDGKTLFAESMNEISSVLPKELDAKLVGRSKGKNSIYEKIVKGVRIKDKIKKTKESNLADADKTAVITKLERQLELLKVDKEVAIAAVDDLIGTRLILNNTSDAQIEMLVNSLSKAISEGKIVIQEIKNYNGDGVKPYFTETQIKKIVDAGRSKGINIKTASGIKPSGYTAVQMKILHSNGALGELQIRGNLVDSVSNWEHIPYDLRMSKDIFLKNNKRGELLLPVQRAIKQLSEEQYKEYSKYLIETYKWARLSEGRQQLSKPKLPQKFDPILSSENMEALSVKLAKIKVAEDKSITTIPQVTLCSGVLPLQTPDTSFVN